MKPSTVIAQTYFNVSALLRHYGIPEPQVIAKQSDRVMFRYSREAEDRLDWLTTIGQWERWDFVGNHGVTAISGWREREARESMQVVKHPHALECDIDRWNPNHGAFPAFCHLLECLVPGQTDPFAVARGLRKRGIDV